MMDSSDDVQNQDRRSFKRVPLRNSVHLSKAGEEDVETTQLLDISLKGMLLKKPDDVSFEAEDSISVTILLNDEQRIELEARVAHVEEEAIGTEWTQIEGESFAHLRRILELNLGDSEEIRRELSELSSDH